MTTTTDPGLVFTEPVTYIATPCPTWCTLNPMHPVDSGGPDDRHSRGHGGPSFGPFLFAGADEFTDAPGVLEYAVQLHAEAENFTDPKGLRDLAEHALAAAEWLEANR